jgi:hypothetical protein
MGESWRRENIENDGVSASRKLNGVNGNRRQCGENVKMVKASAAGARISGIKSSAAKNNRGGGDISDARLHRWRRGDFWFALRQHGAARIMVRV